VEGRGQEIRGTRAVRAAAAGITIKTGKGSELSTKKELRGKRVSLPTERAPAASIGKGYSLSTHTEKERSPRGKKKKSHLGEESEF